MLTKKILILITTTLLICGITSGCDMFSGKSNAQKSLDKLQAKLIKEEKQKDKKANKVAHSNYTYSQKDIFIDDKTNALVKIQKEVDMLTVRLDNSKIKTNAEANQKLDALLDELQQTKTDIEELQNADESKWEEAKTNFNNTNSNLKSSLAETSQWLNEKIEPEKK